MANNLPANIRKHTLFQENEYSHTIVFPEGFTMPDSVTAEVRRDGVVQEGILPTVTVDNLRVTFTYTTEILAKMYSRYEQYFIFGDDYLLGGYVLISNEFGDPDNGETNVIIAGDQVTTIEIPGLAIAEGKLQEVLTAAEQVSQDKQSVSSDKAEVAANTVAVQEAKEEVMGIAARKIDNWQVDTKSDADQFALTLLSSAFIEVLADETQGGVRALYFWNTLTLQEPLLL